MVNCMMNRVRARLHSINISRDLILQAMTSIFTLTSEHIVRSVDQGEYDSTIENQRGCGSCGFLPVAYGDTSSSAEIEQGG